MARWEKKDQDLYMKAGDNHMKNKLFMMEKIHGQMNREWNGTKL